VYGQPYLGDPAFAHDASMEMPQEFATYGGKKKQGYWHRMGGGSLMVSLAVHGVFILIAIFLITLSYLDTKKEEPVDFLPGGGGGGKSNQATMDTKRRSVAMAQPAARIVSNSLNNPVVLPDAPQVTNQKTLSSITMPQSGGLGGGEGGKKGKGKGGLMGDGFGKGFGPGSGAGFVAMFGKSIQAKKLGVVLDISKSMHPFLPTVVREANKIGGGAPVVCYYGCGLTTPKETLKDKAQRTEGKEFDHFWHRLGNGPAPDQNKDVDLNKPLPMQETYEVLNKRRDTFFFEKRGVGNAWLALNAPELRGVDAVYWFADFKDGVDEQQLKELAKEFEKRKQKLYVHASGNDAKSLQAVIDKIVKPSGGEEIKVDLKPTPVKKK
jgi:hypothetical protein